MRRHALGVLAIVLLGIAAGLTLAYWGAAMGPALTDLQAASFRLGVLLAVVWLAYDNLRRVPLWLAVAFLLSLGVVLFVRRLALILVPLIFVAALLGSLGRRRRGR
jgi:hypothetical protein